MSMNTTMTTMTSTGPKGATGPQRGRCICEALSGKPCTPMTPADHATFLKWIEANCPGLIRK